MTGFSFSQILINEFSASNLNQFPDNFGEFEDWVELYNAGGNTVNLSGFYLSDRVNNVKKWEIPPGTTIPPNGFLIIWLSKRNGVFNGNLHANFKVNQTNPNEYIIFADPNGNIIDSVRLITRITQIGHSWGRLPNGSNTWRVFTQPTPGASNGGPNYERYAAPPVFNPQRGFYSAPITVSISTTEPNATIKYTTNGSTPTNASPTYSSPISINSTTVLRAIVFSSNPQVLPSFITTHTYFINEENNSLYVISICGDNIMNLMNGNSITPSGNFELFAPDKTFVDAGYGSFNKHGNDSWAYNQRGIDYITLDEFGYNYAIKGQIFKSRPRKSFQRLILKAAANDNYPFSWGGAHIRDAYVHTLSILGNLYLDERAYEPAIMFVNGQYWGIYEIREKVDDPDFTKYYYNQDKYDLQFIKTWGGTWAEYGGPQALNDWNNLYNWIMSNDMSIPSNFDTVDKYLNWKSLVDYTVLNSYIVNSDWLNWNTGWWRGLNPNGNHKKWGYILWDNDATFNHYINYTGIPDKSANANPCNPESLSGASDPEGHMALLVKLRQNPTFNQYYISRYIDLGNTLFSCPFMLNVLDSLINRIAPEMPRHIQRWGGSLSEWQSNVQALKDFITQRCVAIQQGLVNCYSLNGPYEVTFMPYPSNGGNIKINSITPSNYPFTGLYYGNINVLLTAIPQGGFSFDKWSSSYHSFSPSTADISVSFNPTQKDTIIAYFKTGSEPPPATPNIPYPQSFNGFYIPDAFSPNGDGINDLLFPYIGGDIKNFEIRIFSRWGQEVFHANSFFTWDGTYNKKKLPSGPYTYILHITYKTGQIEKRTGTIHIVDY